MPLPVPPPGFAATMGRSQFQAHLLYNRGVRSPGELESYLAADSRLSNDPFMLPDMDKAVARLRRAVETRELVAVFGDFDADGLTGTALLVEALRELDCPVTSYLPDREREGHGLNPGAIDALDARGVKLVVTVDCGVGSNEEIALAASRGIDTVVTDHHIPPPALPEAAAIVDPSLGESRYPFDGLTGVGLAFKLVEALWAELGRPYPEHLLDLVALGTVADVGRLGGENRYFVRRGLEIINRSPRPGLEALIAKSRLEPGKIDVEALSFKLIPRLNAAGRLGDPSDSLRLLTASSLDEAEPMVEGLEKQNDQRRRLASEAASEALEQVEAMNAVPPLIMVKKEGWLPGILGLIAARMVDTYDRPSIAVSVGPEFSRASARSVPRFDVEHALRLSEGLLERFGGHPQAAGFTVATPRLAELEERLLATASERMDGVQPSPGLRFDCEISPALLGEPTMSFIDSLSPFGPGNPEPVFLTRRARVVEARRVGKTEAHLRLRVVHGGRGWTAVAFNRGDARIDTGDRVDLVYNARINEWNGSSSVELYVLDLR